MTATIPIVLERDNVNDESVTLVSWHARHGEKVEEGVLLAEVETSKANVEVYAPATGYLVQNYAAGAEIPVATAIGAIEAEPHSAEPQVRQPVDAPTPIAKPSTPVRPVATPSLWSDPKFSAVTAKQRISPLAARMMESAGISATVFAGRSVVRKQDVLDCLNPPQNKQASVTTRINQPYKQTTLSKMKRSEGANLAAGVANSVSSTVSVICFTRGLRRVLAEQLAGGNPSAVIIYEVSRLLRKYPTLNAAYCDGCILQYEQVNVGFAMNDGRGLKVAVISQCDTLSLQQIDEQLRELTVAYLEDKLSPAQIANGTFTISDLSGMGISGFSPVISQYQSGILGVSGEQFAPDSAYGFFTLTLNFDHQLSDGRIASLFLNELKERLLHYEATAFRDARLNRPDQLRCSQCFRTAADLRNLKHHLLLSADPEGYLCTICVEGY